MRQVAAGVRRFAAGIQLRQFAAACALLAAGCGVEVVPRYTTMSVRALADPSPPSRAQGGVVVAATAITRTSWLEHRGVVSRLNWHEADNLSQARESQGSVVGFAPVNNLESAQVPLVPLPSFEVRVVNHSAARVTFQNARVELDDGHGRHWSWITDRDEIVRRVEKELIARHRAIADPGNRETLQFAREAVRGLKFLSPSLALEPGGDWQGYVTFDLDAISTADLRAFMLEARELTLRVAGVAPDGQPIELAFPILRKPKGVVCSDGKRRANISDCFEELRTSPAEDGPCIQQTRKPRTIAGMQWWIGGTPVANSDLHRTLLADSVSRAPMKRGLALRAAGYTMIGVGLLATAIAAPTIIKLDGSDYGPAAVGFAGISLVGLVVAIVGTRRSDEAIRLYNEEAEATGLCQPLF